MEEAEKHYARQEKRFHISSLGTGVYEFIPLPFLDEWLIKRQRRGIVESILDSRNITYDAEAPEWIVGSGRSLMGRVGSLTRGLFLKPLRKLFRSVFFWLTAKNAAKTAIATYFLARFLYHPALIAPGQGNHLSSERARFLSEVLREVSRNIEFRAAKGAFQQLIKLFSRSGKASADEIGRTIERASPGFVDRFDTMVTERLAV